MASVFKPKNKSKYVILYTDETGRRRKKTGATDKAVTQRIARDLENRVVLRREGVIDAKADTPSSATRRAPWPITWTTGTATCSPAGRPPATPISTTSASASWPP
jgi:hypothetical protein